MLAVVGCGAPCRPTERVPAGQPSARVAGRAFPWDVVSIRFLGLRDLGVPNGDDVELRWEVQHPVLGWDHRLTITPAVGSISNAETLEMHLERSDTRTIVRVRVSIEDAFPSGSQVETSVGLLIEATLPDRERWETAPRSISLGEPGPQGRPLPEREVSSDGRLEIELRVAPDVPTREGAWVMEAGRTYEIAYRVHNRTDTDASVRLVDRTPRTMAA